MATTSTTTMLSADRHGASNVSDALQLQEDRERASLTALIDHEIKNVKYETLFDAELAGKKELLVIAVHEFTRSIDERQISDFTVTIITDFIQKCLLLFSKCHLGSDFDDDFVYLVGLFQSWDIAPLRCLTDEDYRHLLQEAKVFLSLPAEEILMDLDAIADIQAGILTDVDRSCEFFSQGAASFGCISQYRETAGDMLAEISALTKQPIPKVQLGRRDSITAVLEGVQSLYQQEDAQFQDPEHRRSMVQTIDMLEKEANLNTVTLDQKLDESFEELARRQIKAADDFETWNDRLKATVSEHLTKQLVVAHKIDVGSKVTVIPNINECVRKMTSLVYDKDEQFRNFMQLRFQHLNEKYTEAHLRDDDTLLWLRQQALRKYQISEDISDALTTIYSDMVNCYLQQTRKVAPTST